MLVKLNFVHDFFQILEFKAWNKLHLLFLHAFTLFAYRREEKDQI